MSDTLLDFLEAVTTVYRSYQARRHPLRFFVGPVSRKREEAMPLDIQIYDDEKVKVMLQPDGPVDGEPQWQVISGNATVAVDAGGMSAYLISEDNLMITSAETVYEVSADVDLGAGTVPLSDQITLHVSARPATTLGLQVSSPEPK